MSQYSSEDTDELIQIEHSTTDEYIRLQMAGEREQAKAVLNMSLDMRRELSDRGVQFDNFFLGDE